MVWNSNKDIMNVIRDLTARCNSYLKKLISKQYEILFKKMRKKIICAKCCCHMMAIANFSQHPRHLYRYDHSVISSPMKEQPKPFKLFIRVRQWRKLRLENINNIGENKPKTLKCRLCITHLGGLSELHLVCPICFRQ